MPEIPPFIAIVGTLMCGILLMGLRLYVTAEPEDPFVQKTYKKPLELRTFIFNYYMLNRPSIGKVFYVQRIEEGQALVQLGNHPLSLIDEVVPPFGKFWMYVEGLSNLEEGEYYFLSLSGNEWIARSSTKSDFLKQAKAS